MKRTLIKQTDGADGRLRQRSKCGSISSRSAAIARHTHPASNPVRRRGRNGAHDRRPGHAQARSGRWIPGPDGRAPRGLKRSGQDDRHLDLRGRKGQAARFPRLSRRGKEEAHVPAPIHADNSAQAEYWNCERRTVMDGPPGAAGSVLRPISDRLMASTAPGLADGIIDIGCGCGETTVDLAAPSRPEARSSRSNISEPMMARARDGAKSCPSPFVRADATVYEFGPAGADLVTRDWRHVLRRIFTIVRRDLAAGAGAGSLSPCGASEANPPSFCPASAEAGEHAYSAPDRRPDPSPSPRRACRRSSAIAVASPTWSQPPRFLARHRRRPRLDSGSRHDDDRRRQQMLDAGGERRARQRDVRTLSGSRRRERATWRHVWLVTRMDRFYSLRSSLERQERPLGPPALTDSRAGQTSLVLFCMTREARHVRNPPKIARDPGHRCRRL